MTLSLTKKQVEEALGPLRRLVTLEHHGSFLILTRKGFFLQEDESRLHTTVLTPLGFHRIGHTNAYEVPIATMSVDVEDHLQEIPLDNIELPPFLVRSSVDPQVIEEKAEDLRRHNIINPITVRPLPTGKYEVVAGGLRFESATRAGFSTVRCIVRSLDDQKALELALSENLHRTPLTDYDVARTLRYMLDTYPQRYPTHISLATVFGKSEAWVTRHLGMLDLESTVPRPLLSKMSEGLARTIRSLPDDRRSAAVGHVMHIDEATGKMPSMAALANLVDLEKNSEESPREPDAETSPPTERKLVFEYDCPFCGHAHSVMCDGTRDWVETRSTASPQRRGRGPPGGGRGAEAPPATP